MAKAKKSTKKFLTKKAGGKQEFHKKPKWKRTAKDGAAATGAAAEEAAGKPVEELDVDEFLAGDFLGGYGSQSASDEEGDGDGSGSDSEAEGGSMLASDDDDDVEVAAAGGRKRRAAAAPADAPSSSDGDDASDSDSDSGEDGAAGVLGQNRRLADEVASHRAQLEALQNADPEFYAYLQATDNQLLAFGQGEDAAGGQDSDEEEQAGEESEDDAAAAGQGDDDTPALAAAPAAAAFTVTLDMVNTWTAAALGKASFGAVRSLLRAYRVACHFGDSEEGVDEGMRIGSSAVYNRLMLFVLKEADGILRRMLGAEEGGRTLEAASLTRLPRWRKVEPLVKSYLGNTLHLLGQMTEAGMLAFILRRVRASTPLLAPYDKLQRRYLKAALQLFGSAEAAPRVQAILLVRHMAVALPPPSMDACLKGVYRAFSANAKFVSAASAPHINFMASCVVELYGLNAEAAYQHAFGFIRQLAVLLRQALTSKTKDSYREVYCWQTVNCLELWAKVAAAHAETGGLRPLVYPVVQMLLGAARLVATPSYFPLRLRLARALNRLAQATGVYVPVAPLLLEVLQWGDLSRAPKPSPGDKAPEVLLQLRVGKAAARSAAYQEEIVEQVLELLADHLSQWSCHVAFPELAHLPLTQLRRFAKTTPVERFRRGSRQLADAIERNITFVGRARDGVDFSPKDLQQAASFLAADSAKGAAPVQQHATTLRERAKQRLTLRMAHDMRLDGKERAGGLTQGEGDDDDVEEPSGSLLPKKGAAKKRKAQEQAAAEAAEAEAGKGKSKRSKAGAAPQEDVIDDGEGADDVVAAYELSDDEEEEADDGGAGQLGWQNGGAKRQAARGGSDSSEEEEEERRGGGGGGGRGGRGRGGRGRGSEGRGGGRRSEGGRGRGRGGRGRGGRR